jgi:Zn-dependent peptidase ImmA (M78 family)
MKTGMTKNYLTLQERKRIDSLIDDIRLDTGKSYPEDHLIDIVKGAIPGVKILEDDFSDIKNIPVDPKSIRGMILKKSEEFVTPKIVIQKKLTPEAKTFALAHEFAHYVIGHPSDKNYFIDRFEYDGSIHSQMEAQAQYFAASLLMPKEKFLWLAKVLDDSKLAKRFGVSAAAVRVRKKWLRNI